MSMGKKVRSPLSLMQVMVESCRHEQRRAIACSVSKKTNGYECGEGGAITVRTKKNYLLLRTINNLWCMHPLFESCFGLIPNNLRVKESGSR